MRELTCEDVGCPCLDHEPDKMARKADGPSPLARYTAKVVDERDELKAQVAEGNEVREYLRAEVRELQAALEASDALSIELAGKYEEAQAALRRVGASPVLRKVDAPAAEAAEAAPDHDPVNRPKHYTGHPSGIECIEITEHYDFVIGNIIKYAWRAGLKGGSSKVQDLEKCHWYAGRAIERERKLAQGD